MRDPARIDAMLERLRQVWQAHPDLRLGQLVQNAARIKASELQDVFYIEDEALFEGLGHLAQEMEGSKTR